MFLHHVQVSMLAGREEEARNFYAEALGLFEVPKPSALRGRGGCWFRAIDEGRVVAEIHVGVEQGFSPSEKAHPAFAVESIAALERVATKVADAGFKLSWSERHSFEGYERFHCRDPFGNRIEVLAQVNK